MNKYLFTDGTNGVTEAHTTDELLSLINSAAEPGKARVWVFSTNEWMSCADFFKKYPGLKKAETITSPAITASQPVKRKSKYQWMKRTAFAAVATAVALLIFNFTGASWQKTPPLKATAARPSNVPLMDMDSLINEIELLRGKALDKGTSYNLRLRNNWPDHILLQLNADKETKGGVSRFLNVTVSIDNATGFNIDGAGIKLQLWKKGKASKAGEIQVKNIAYGKQAQHVFSGVFNGDSISASFQTIRAKAFNFCYDAEKENSSGNYNDRWFCRDGKPAN